MANEMVVNDPIHGLIRLPQVCRLIIDTPQVQRLRHIKQLDAVYLVYPGASHNRFEHSIGVSYLAGKLLKALNERQRDEKLMDEKDILCVQIAGLCKDLGRGPFSRIFEKFIQDTLRTEPEYQHWRHEKASVMMYEALLKADNGTVKTALQRTEQFDDEDFKFIEELIDVPKDMDSEVWPYSGRRKEKSFLYEIVANYEHCVDVDTWDSIARDGYMLGIKTGFDHNRCIENAKIIEERGRKRICYRDKIVYELYLMHTTRVLLNLRAYQHKTHNSIGIMIRNALEEANAHLKFAGQEGIANAIKKGKSYLELTDDVLVRIKLSEDQNLKAAQNIIEKITSRQLYKFVGETPIRPDGNQSFDKNKFIEYLIKEIKGQGTQSLTPDSVAVDVLKIDYGIENKNPMKNVYFYKKGNGHVHEIQEDQIPFYVPPNFGQTIVRVYYKNKQDKDMLKSTEIAFGNWCKANNQPLPRDF